MSLTVKQYEEYSVVGVINPSSQAAGEALTAAIDLSKWADVMAVLSVGALGASATVDATWKAATTSGGTYAAVSGTGITQLTKADSDDNKQVLVHLRPIETAGKRYAKFSVTVAVAACLTSVVVLGRPVVKPATDNDLTTVDEVVN